MLTLIKEDKITSTFSTPIGYFRVPEESHKTAPSADTSQHGYLDYFQVGDSYKCFESFESFHQNDSFTDSFWEGY